MKQTGTRVGTPPPRPVMIFDGDCGFCRRSVRTLAARTGQSVEFLAQQDQECRVRFPELERDALLRSVHLVETDGSVHSGADAVFRALAQRPAYRWPSALYSRSRVLAWLMEGTYSFIARHRMLFSRILGPFLRE